MDKKKEEGIVEQAIRDQAEIDIARQRQEVREGVIARDEAKVIQTKEELRRKEIGDKYLGGDIYEEDKIVNEFHVFGRQTVNSVLEMGKRLLAAKEYEGHGKFMKMLGERFKISEPTAWRLMAIAKKFLNSSRVKDLPLTGMQEGIGKLYALLNVPDEELVEFDETGLFKGATVEDINKMSVKEFRKLIVEKEDWKAKARQLEMEIQGKYDTTTRYKKTNEKLEKENARLKAELEEARTPLPRETKEAIAVMEKFKERAKFVFYFFNSVNPDGYHEIIRLELLNAVYYLCDVFTLLAHKTSNLNDITRPYPAHILESEMKAFGQKYKGDDDLGIGLSDEEKEEIRKNVAVEMAKEEELGKENARLRVEGAKGTV